MTAQGPRRPIAAIVYLDVDDEITSAATRIRTVPERRLAIVLPGGSRVSTSRINFRLLAREAAARGRELAIVAPEAPARALAASAGLPVFASVAEYEDALANLRADDDAGPTAGPTGLAAAGDEDGASDAADRAARPDGPTGQLTGWWAHDAAESTPRPGRASIGGPAGSAGGGLRSGSGVRGRGIAGGRVGPPGAAPSAGFPGSSGGAGVRPRTSVTDTVILPPPDRAEDRPRRRVPGLVLALVSVLIVLLVVGGVAGWLFLPDAMITVAARVDPVGPQQFTVRADPLEVSENVAQGIVPAQVVTFDLAVSQDFPSSGKKIAETKASGNVQWTNCDPTRAYTIPSGTLAQTVDGQQFATTDAVFLPVAILSGNPPTISCQSRTVGVTAKASGTAGNVDAGTITVVPPDYNSVVIRVTNANPTTGGTHTETKIVAQKDVDAAVTTLTKALRDEFTTQLADPSKVPPGTTLFVGTRSMSSGDPTVDPSTLVGQATATFTLGITGSGTATAVDVSTVQALGDQRIRGAVATDESLVKDSVSVTVGTGRVDGSAVLFPVTARAQEVDAPDVTAIRAMVKGLSVDAARDRLRNYGDATVDVWPGWVTTITTYDFRLDVRVISDVQTEPTIPVPSVSPSGAPSAGPSAPSSAVPSSAPGTSSEPSGSPSAAGSSGPPASASPRVRASGSPASGSGASAPPRSPAPSAT